MHPAFLLLNPLRSPQPSFLVKKFPISLPPLCSSTPPNPEQPRTSPSPPCLSRRAFLSLLLTIPFLPSSANSRNPSNPVELDFQLPSTPSHFPYHEEEKEGAPLHASPEEYRSAVHVGQPGGTARTARIYLLRAGVVAFVAAFSATGMAISEREALRIRLPVEYDPGVLARYFAIRPDKVLYRLMQVVCEIVSFGWVVLNDAMADKIDRMWVRVGNKSVEWCITRAEIREERRARLLREGITRLGPAMIKLGQAAGTRPDLFGGKVVRELQRLQDDVVGDFPTLEALNVIWDELGANPAVLFEALGTERVAAASLGMVFKGRVEGCDVAVKVQRPGVQESVAMDCYIVRGMAEVANRVLGSRTDFCGAVDEYSSRLFEELDYEKELRNLLEFRKLYGGMKGVYLPRAFPRYCSRKVLVTEWVDGVKLIDDEVRVRREDLGIVETGIRFALTQLLDKGFLHADMHNGNMLRTKSGYLAYIDFGLVSEVPASVRESIVCALMHLIHGEYTHLAECFTGLALMRSNDIEVDLPLLSEALREAFEPTNQALAACRKRGASRFQHFTLIGIVGKLLSLGTRFPFVFNDYFLNNLRCLGMLEGIALNADPNFNVLGVVYPYVVKKILTDPTPRYRHALESLVIDSYGRMRWSRMEQLLQDVQDSAATTMQGHADPVTPLGISKAESRKYSDNARLKMNANETPSPDLLLTFLTSPSGYFLRKYITAQYVSNFERRWRARIDEHFHRSRPLEGALQATARELSDDEARERARAFFRSTPFMKRFRVLFWLLPEFLVPLSRAIVRVIGYIMQQIISNQSRAKTSSTRRSRHTVKRSPVAWPQTQSQNGVPSATVTRWSTGNTPNKNWRPFHSSFLERTQLRRLSKHSS